MDDVTGVHGTYDPDADWDGDGAANYAEYVAGTDPNKADDCFEIGAFTVDDDLRSSEWRTVLQDGSRARP